MTVGRLFLCETFVLCCTRMIHGIVSVLIVLVVFILYTEIRKIIIKRKLGQFESIFGIPILGVGGRFLKKRNDEIIETVFGLFDEVTETPAQAWLGPVLVIGVAEPKDLQTLLASEDCLNKSYFYDHFHCKTSIISTTREQWKPHRRALNGVFNLRALQTLVPILNEKSRILLTKMEPLLIERGNLYRTIFICMIDMISRTITGEEMNLQSERGGFYYEKAKIFMNNVM